MSPATTWMSRQWLARDPDRFYGPVMLGLASLSIITTCVGQSFLLGQFKEPMQDSLGLSGTRMASLYLLATFVGGMAMLPAGVLVDRLGLRRVYLWATPILAGVCLLTASATRWWWLLAGLLGLRMLGQGLMELLGNNTVSMWYRRRLGRASTVTTLTFAIGLLVLPPLVQLSIAAWGWRITYVVMGAAVLATMLPMWLAYINRPEAIGQRLDGERPTPQGITSLEHTPMQSLSRTAAADSEAPSLTLSEARRTRTFWILMMALVYYAMVLTASVYCVNSVLVERGMPGEQGAWMISALGGAMAVFYPVVGWLADRWPVRWLQAIATAALIGSVLILYLTASLWQVVLMGLVLGLCVSAQAAVGATVWVRRFGRDHLGSIRGAVQTVAIAGSSAGPFILEWMAILTANGFDQALLLLAALGTPVLLMSGWLRSGPPE